MSETKSKLKGKKPEIKNTGHLKMLIFGPSGVGKSWFALDLPNAYYNDTEGGARLAHYQQKLAKSGGVYLGPEDGALSFDDLINQMKALAQEDHGYKTLVIDSITKIYQTAIAETQAKLGDKDVYGASKKPATAAMRQLMNWITRLDMNVVIIAHETVEWGINPKTQQREEIGKTADVFDKLIYDLDLTIQIQKRGNTRVGIVRKSRLLGFPEGEVFDLDYPTFADRYGKDFIEAKPKSITLAKPDQIAEIKRLLEVVKIDEDTIGKWFTKAGASDWSDFNEETAASIITFLTNKTKV